MLSPAMNDCLTRVGPTIPGGKLMRRFRIPIASYSQLGNQPDNSAACIPGAG